MQNWQISNVWSWSCYGHCLSFFGLQQFFINFIRFAIAKRLYYFYCNCKLIKITWSIVDGKFTNFRHLESVLLLPLLWFFQASKNFLSILFVLLLQTIYIIQIAVIHCLEWLDLSLIENWQNLRYLKLVLLLPPLPLLLLVVWILLSFLSVLLF